MIRVNAGVRRKRSEILKFSFEPIKFVAELPVKIVFTNKTGSSAKNSIALE